MFFVEKHAIYSHGIFWIGESLQEAQSEAHKFALGDVDKHHNWSVYEFEKQPYDAVTPYYSNSDADHRHIATYQGKTGILGEDGTA